MEKHLKDVFIGMAWGLILCAIISFFVTKDEKQGGQNTCVEQLTDTIRYVDTISYYNPVQKSSTEVRYVTRVLPVNWRDSITTNKIDTFLSEDSSQDNGENTPPFSLSDERDSAAVVIPITQKRYENDDYRVYVSGYEPSLDSIFVFPKTTIIRKRNKPPNKWHIGITGGYGYGFNSRQAEPYIGIGITYSIISF